jgi:hypothetical protein
MKQSEPKMQSVLRNLISLLLLTLPFIVVSCQKTEEGPKINWEKTYGGPNYDVGYLVQQTSDGGYIIAGYTSSFGAGGQDVYLIKTDNHGDTLWTQTYGGANSDFGYSVQQTSDGGYIITRNTNSFGAGAPGDVWLIKTDSLGDTLWTKTFGGDSSDAGHSVQQTADSGYIITGFRDFIGGNSGNVWLIKTDSLGDTLWTKTFGGNSVDIGNSVQQTADSGYIITGNTMSFGAGDFDIYIIKTESDVGIEEKEVSSLMSSDFGATIISGPLLLPKGEKCKIFDITGRITTPDKIQPGVYFIEVDGKIIKKVVKIK